MVEQDDVAWRFHTFSCNIGEKEGRFDCALPC